MSKLKIYFLNIYSYLLFFVFSLFCIPLLTFFVACASVFVSPRKTMRLFRRAIKVWGRGITLIPYPAIKVCYEDHSGDSINEPNIFVCNHRAASDGFLMSILTCEGVQVVNVWPFRIPVIGFFARKAGYLNIKMMNSDVFFNDVVELIKEKVSIIFFPEGTRSASRKMGNFHGAAFRLALMSKAPIVPLCITGNENVPPKGSLLLRPAKIRVRRLPAITWNEYREMNVFTLKNKVREIMSKELLLMENKA